MRWESDTRDTEEAKPSAVVTDGMRLSGRRENCSGAWAGGEEQLRLEGSGSLRVLRYNVCVRVSCAM